MIICLKFLSLVFNDLNISENFIDVLCAGDCETRISMVANYYQDYNLKLSSNEIINKLPSKSIPAIYKNVTISLGGDNFEKGGIQKDFKIEKEYSSMPLFLDSDIAQWFSTGCGKETYISNPHTSLTKRFKSYRYDIKTNLGQFNGRLEREIFFNKINETINKYRKTEYEYEDVIQQSITNCFLTRVFDIIYRLHEPYTGNVSIIPIDYKIYKSYLKKVINTEFIDTMDYLEFFHQYYVRGDAIFDFDGDGIKNFMDPDYIITFDEYESTRRKIVNETLYFYDETNKPSLPNRIETGLSDGSIKKTKLYYPITNQINMISNNLQQSEINSYSNLFNANKIGKPFQIEIYNDNTKLSTKRVLYNTFNQKALPKKILSSKGDNTLELDEEVWYYDSRSNPTYIIKKGNERTYLKWSNRRELLVKAENVGYENIDDQFNSGSGITISDDGVLSSNYSQIYTNLPNARIQFFEYKPFTRNLIKMIDIKGYINTYFYDDGYNVLKQIKDNDNDIIKEFDYNFRPQN